MGALQQYRAWLIAGAVVVLLAMGTGFGWVLNGWRLEGRVADAKAETANQAALHKADLAAISNAAAQQVTQALAKQQEAQQAVAELDKKATKERNDAKAENDRLRARLDAGGRVRVAGNCPTNPASVTTALVGAALTGIGFSLVFPALAVEAVQRVPSSNRGAALAGYSVFIDLSLAVTGPLIGAVATHFGYAASFLCAALAALAGLALSVRLLCRFDESSREQP